MNGDQRARDEKDGNGRQDRQVEESFPASDPPATTPVRGPGEASRHEEAEESQPKGQPSDERLQSETASAKIQGVKPPQADHR